MTTIIRNFKGPYAFLSNFFEPSPVVWGYTYNSVENAYQAGKCKKDDVKGRAQFLKLTPAQAKKLGQKVTMREDWEEVKLRLMEHLLRQKFAIPELKEQLLKTGDAILEEGNWWGDRFWGTCYNKEEGVWEGENHLGKLLMKIRDELK